MTPSLLIAAANALGLGTSRVSEPATPHPSPEVVRLTDIARDKAHLHSERDRLTSRQLMTRQTLAALDDGLGQLAFEARIENNSSAARQLSAETARRRELEDETRTDAAALARLDERLEELDADEREAELTLHEAESMRLASAQAEMAAELDVKATALADALRAFVAAEVERDMADRALGVSSARNIVDRLADALSFHLWSATLPPAYSARAVAFELTCTQAHRHLRFVDAVRPPARRRAVAVRQLEEVGDATVPE